MGFRLHPIYNATVSIENTVYGQDRGSVSTSFADARRASRETGSLAWISLVEPDESDFDVIASSLGLEPRLLRRVYLARRS